MAATSIAEIVEKLRRLPPKKREVVSDFVSYLASRKERSPALETMLATEEVLRRDWDSPEEDEAWADL